MSGPYAGAPGSLHTLERALRKLLRARGRPDLACEALDRIAYTDDGATIYVHVFARPAWPHRRPGQAYVLAFSEKRDLKDLGSFRQLVQDAWLQLEDEIEDIIRWFDGR